MKIKNEKKRRGGKCPHPGCDIPIEEPQPRCICKDPIYIVIPPGGHIHIDCPRHGDVVIYGPNFAYLQDQISKLPKPCTKPRNPWTDDDDYFPRRPWEIICKTSSQSATM